MTHTITLEIEAESQNHAESLYHEISKQVDDANRFGVDVAVRRIQEDTEHNTEFDQ